MVSIVTGGCGFIGSHIVDKLLKEGHKVRVIDNLSTGRMENLEHHKDNEKLEIFNVDIRNVKEIRKIFENVTYVFHMAALADIVPSIQKPTEYYTSNVLGTFNVLELSRKNNIKKLVYAASSSCYGIAKDYPTNENCEISPQYPYALSKYIGEETILHWGKVYKLPVISLRMFNVYGTRSRTSGTYGAVLGVFLAQKLSNKPFTVVGDGNQTRDFTYVTDVAEAFYTAAISNISNEIFNVCSGGTYSINKLCELLQGEKVYIPKRPGESDCTFADITKISNMLDWKPKISLEEGIKIILENIDYWKKAPVWTPESIEKETEDWFKYLS